MECLELIKTDRKYYNVSPIECFESYLNKEDVNIRSWNNTKNVVYTHRDSLIEDYCNHEYESINDPDLFNYKNLMECLVLYPYISLLTTFKEKSNIEPLYVVTYIQDTNNKQIEICDGIEMESYQFEYEIWCNRVVGYSIIKPNHLIQFIVDSIVRTTRDNRINYYQYASSFNLEDDHIFDYDSTVFQNIWTASTVKENKTIEICKKVFPNAKYELLQF